MSRVSKVELIAISAVMSIASIGCKTISGGGSITSEDLLPGTAPLVLDCSKEGHAKNNIDDGVISCKATVGNVDFEEFKTLERRNIWQLKNALESRICANYKGIVSVTCSVSEQNKAARFDEKLNKVSLIVYADEKFSPELRTTVEDSIKKYQAVSNLGFRFTNSVSEATVYVLSNSATPADVEFSSALEKWVIHLGGNNEARPIEIALGQVLGLEKADIKFTLGTFWVSTQEKIQELYGKPAPTPQLEVPETTRFDSRLKKVSAIISAETDHGLADKVKIAMKKYQAVCNIGFRFADNRQESTMIVIDNNSASEAGVGFQGGGTQKWVVRVMGLGGDQESIDVGLGKLLLRVKGVRVSENKIVFQPNGELSSETVAKFQARFGKPSN